MDNEERILSSIERKRIAEKFTEKEDWYDSRTDSHGNRLPKREIYYEDLKEKKL